MKKIFELLLIVFCISSSVLAIEDEVILQQAEEKLNNTTASKEENFELPIILEPEEVAPEVKEEERYSPYSKEALKGILTKEYDLNSPSGMFKDQLTFKFKKGPFEELGTQLNLISTMTETMGEETDSNFKFKMNTINYAIRGKFRGGKESFNILTDMSPIKQNFMHRFILDAFIETKRIPHHSLIFGTSRPFVGYEGGMSPYLIPLIARSQTARNFGNVRKTGIRLKGDFKYIDYDIGGYSSDTFYSEFFPGVETDLWLNFKPLANLNPEKAGKLNISGGFQTGMRNGHDYRVMSSALRYDYKRLGFTSEFQYADGSNGASGITEDQRWGYNATLMYRLTKKLQIVARFDDFNNNTHIAHNNTREYTAGINYFILGQTFRMMLNYVYCQNMAANDTHKIIIGGQMLL